MNSSKIISLVPDPLRPGGHRGFGYVEFDTEQAATAAVMSMNRFDLGGQLLRVTKAISPPDGINTNPVLSHLPAATAVAAASVTAKLLSMETEMVRSCMLVHLLSYFSHCYCSKTLIF